MNPPCPVPSHSWSDNGVAKHAALQSWGAEFKREHGREPLVWFDRACIDQQKIEESLSGIPTCVSPPPRPWNPKLALSSGIKSHFPASQSA